MSNKQKIESDGITLIRHLFFAENKRIFNTEQAREAAAKIGIPQNTLNVILSRLFKQGIIRRIRRGLYASVGILGEVESIHPYVISAFLVQPSAISHWSALQHHGLTEQIPLTIMASTPMRVYTPSMRDPHLNDSDHKHAWVIDETRYEYITIQEKHFNFGMEKIWIDPHFVVQITDKERTLLDVFVYSKMFGGMGGALGILEEALGDIDIQRFANYAKQYDEKAVAKRIGWALEYFGVDEQYLRPLLDIPLASYCLLDPVGSAVGPCDKRWMIQNNLTKGEN
ncbi:MAG: type IV toxin-antitoxin system AbiEi family antitoxin domain-containing protein [Gammaproteobacteria bacterium]